MLALWVMEHSRMTGVMVTQVYTIVKTINMHTSVRLGIPGESKQMQGKCVVVNK